MCYSLDEMLQTWVHCYRSHETFWKQTGITNAFWPAYPLSHNTTAIYLLSTELGCHAEIYFTSHCWSYHNRHSYDSLLSLLPYLYQLIPSRDAVLFQTNFTADYRVSRVLILSFELPDISFWAEATSQHVNCLTEGNRVSSLICFQWNFTELGTSIFLINIILNIIKY